MYELESQNKETNFQTPKPRGSTDNAVSHVSFLSEKQLISFATRKRIDSSGNTVACN